MMKTTAFVLLVSMLAGCGVASEPNLSLDAAVDAPNTEIPKAPLGPQTYDYVINHILFDEGAEPGVTTRAFYGFNIDGRYSPSTTAQQQAVDASHGDYFSTVDPDQNTGTCMAGFPGGGQRCRGGVDNQLPNVVQTIQQFRASLNVQELTNNAINSGHGIIAIRLTDVDGRLGPTLNDPEINAYVYHVYPAFVNCENIQQGNQIYTVDNDSLEIPNDITSARFHFNGRIDHGRVIINSVRNQERPNFPLSIFDFSLMGMPINLPLYNAQFRFNPGETEATGGNLGGYIRQTDFITALTTIPALVKFRDAAVPLIQGFVDIPTGYPSASADAPNGGIGIGMGFSMKIAQLTQVTTDVAPYGVCGASIHNINTDAGFARDAAIHD